LEEAVPLMAEYELGKRLTQQDVDSIVTWLKSLTGEIAEDYIRKPELPATTPRTPMPHDTD
jgi:cytochrome c peroxidase